MEAIRLTVKVKDHKIIITLPDDFNADVVDIIILPSKNEEYVIPQLQMNVINESTEKYLKNPTEATDNDAVIKEFESDFILTNQQMKILDESAKEDRSTFITAEESLLQIKKRYEL